jgi:hypothetical protein
VQRFWRRTGLDDALPQSDLLARLAEDGGHATRGGGGVVEPRNEWFAGLLGDAVRELEEARWLLELQESVSRMGTPARESALSAFRDRCGQSEVRRAVVIAALRRKTETRWARDVESPITRSASELVQEVRDELSHQAAETGAGKGAVETALRNWCRHRLTEWSSSAIGTLWRRPGASLKVFPTKRGRPSMIRSRASMSISRAWSPVRQRFQRPADRPGSR